MSVATGFGIERAEERSVVGKAGALEAVAMSSARRSALPYSDCVFLIGKSRLHFAKSSAL